MAFRLNASPPPYSLHPDTLASGRHGYAMRTEQGIDAVFYFCPLHRASAIYAPAHGYWTLRTPDTFGAFLQRLSERGIVFPDDDECRDWIEACGLTPPVANPGAAH